MKILKVTNNCASTLGNAASFETSEKTQTTNSPAIIESRVFTCKYLVIFLFFSLILKLRFIFFKLRLLQSMI